MWQPRYSKTIEKKLFALRAKLVAEGASSEVIRLQSAELIATEQAKARERKKRKIEKHFSALEKREIFTHHTDTEGCEIRLMLVKDVGIVVQQTTLPLQSEVFYSWSLPNELGSDNYVPYFTFEGANKTALCTVLPDSFILVLDKLNKNGKKCGKLYVDMFFQKIHPKGFENP